MLIDYPTPPLDLIDNRLLQARSCLAAIQGNRQSGSPLSAETVERIAWSVDELLAGAQGASGALAKDLAAAALSKDAQSIAVRARDELEDALFSFRHINGFILDLINGPDTEKRDRTFAALQALARDAEAATQRAVSRFK